MKSIAEIRRDRLRELIRDHDAGRTSGLTERMGWKSQPLASKYVSETPSNQKSIGEALARRIEKVYGKPRGWLDSPVELGTFGSVKMGPLEKQLLATFQRLSSNSQELVLGRVQALYLQEHPATEFGPTVFESDVRERHEADKDRTTRRTAHK